jgi:UDP-glucose 4-epimerase
MDGELGPTGQRVLVTGGAGFIGSHLADALVGDNEVVVLDDFSGGFREQVPDAARVVEGDVRDPDVLDRAMDGVDVVFHEAAVVSVPKTVADPVGSDAVNATASLRLLERAREASARVVCASSAAVYGNPEDVPVAERHPLRPTSPYGVQKQSLDAYARIYADLYDLETVVLRYFNVYGPRAEAGEYGDVVSVFRRQARAGGPITVEGSGDQTRDFVHVDDVVQANLRAATAGADAVGEAYNVGSGESIRIAALARRVRDLADADAEITHVDPRPGDIDESLADVSKARERLGYEPTVDLDDGLASLV